LDEFYNCVDVIIVNGGETGSTNRKNDNINLPLIWEGRPLYEDAS